MIQAAVDEGPAQKHQRVPFWDVMQSHSYWESRAKSTVLTGIWGMGYINCVKTDSQIVGLVDGVSAPPYHDHSLPPATFTFQTHVNFTGQYLENYGLVFYPFTCKNGGTFQGQLVLWRDFSEMEKILHPNTPYTHRHEGSER